MARTSAAAPKAGEAAGQGLWSGTISFSLVAIPVRLVKAVEPGRVSFRLLHGKDFAPLQRRMLCPKEGKIVPQDEIVRGYEIGPDKYVTVTDEELESVSPERSRTIEILEFVDGGAIDPLYYDHPYYLVPGKGGEKAYRLLVEALRRTKKIGLATFVLADRQHVVAVKSVDRALCLITLHYGDDILPAADLAVPARAVDAKSRSLLHKDIKGLMADFDPGKYADLRRKRIADLLRRKAKEGTPVEAPATEEREGAGPPDLVAALREAMRTTKKKR